MQTRYLDEGLESLSMCRNLGKWRMALRGLQSCSTHAPEGQGRLSSRIHCTAPKDLSCGISETQCPSGLFSLCTVQRKCSRHVWIGRARLKRCSSYPDRNKHSESNPYVRVAASEAH